MSATGGSGRKVTPPHSNGGGVTDDKTISSRSEQAELREVVVGADRLTPSEREIIELKLGHELTGADRRCARCPAQPGARHGPAGPGSLRIGARRAREACPELAGIPRLGRAAHYRCVSGSDGISGAATLAATGSAVKPAALLSVLPVAAASRPAPSGARPDLDNRPAPWPSGWRSATGRHPGPGILPPSIHRRRSGCTRALRFVAAGWRRDRRRGHRQRRTAAPFSPAGPRAPATRPLPGPPATGRPGRPAGRRREGHLLAVQLRTASDGASPLRAVAQRPGHLSRRRHPGYPPRSRAP
jgi:hypothetical protein